MVLRILQESPTDCKCLHYLRERRRAPRAALRAPRAAGIGPTLHILGVPGILFSRCNMGASHPIKSLVSAGCAVSYRRTRPRPLPPVPAPDNTWQIGGLRLRTARAAFS